MLWDIFCKVIDNHGDLGVCWRLAAEIAARGDEVRLWADDATALQWMAPHGHESVTLVPWTATPPALIPGDAVIEAFGCDPPTAFVDALARKTRETGRQPPWINLEYLSAEPFVERSHGLPSPVQSGPGAGLTKHFFFPGFTQKTGGLLREQDFEGRRARHDRTAWFASQRIAVDEHTRCVSLFCYEPPALGALLSQLGRSARPTVLLITEGRARRAVQHLLPHTNRHGNLSFHYLPWLTQPGYDELLWSCDFNFVRGEDSLVRAIWAGKPFVWQPYVQDDGAHELKLQAFLNWLDAPADLRLFHFAWSGFSQALPPIDWEAWPATAELARGRAWQLPELATSLKRFVSRTATI